ncbi:hypothetical protein ACGH2B_13055 [Streptomyces sp. BBFR2]|uniref:hypothetical protein n=1 Tax=Streptomyces sp. BBFR2 TaxID=3372854 RepID=UPI0037D9E753
MTAQPPTGPARVPPPPRPVLSLPPGFIQGGAGADAAVRAAAAGRADGTRPGPGIPAGQDGVPPGAPAPATPGTWLPANDGTGPYAGGPLAALPTWRPESRAPWAIAWTGVSTAASVMMLFLGGLFGYFSPMFCGSCDRAELDRFGVYYWCYWAVLLLVAVLALTAAVLPMRKRFAVARVVVGATAMLLSFVAPVVYHQLLTTVH